MRVDERTEVVATGRSEPPFDELYARLAPSAGRLAYLLTGNRELAEDLVHDAFIKTVGRWERIRNPEAFDAYLRRTIINLTRSHHRRRLVERRYLQARASQIPVTESPAETHLDDDLRNALLALPPRQRAAIVLRFFEDLSEAQTAELMVVSVGTVKSLTSRGMAKLRKVLDVEQV